MGSASVTRVEPLGPVRLNRALLARQHLLERARDPISEVVGHLVGLQAQNPPSPHLALWSRVEGLAHDEVGDGLQARALVRIAVMRSTVHLVTAADAGVLHALSLPRIRGELTGNPQHRADIAALDVEAVAAQARAVLEAEPLTAVELGLRLSPCWPQAQPAALARVARALLPLVQVPPRGRWRRSGRTTWTTVQAWLGEEADHLADPDRRAGALADLVERYLAAFGPATVADVQAWSGLTGLRAVVEAMGDRLVRLRGEPTPGGSRERALLDLPGGLLPDDDVVAPPRFLPDFDNLLLSYADRSRVIPPVLRARLSSTNGQAPPTVLVDGFVAGTWRVHRAGRLATLVVTPWTAWSRDQVGRVRDEGEAMVRWWADDADDHAVQVAAP